MYKDIKNIIINEILSDVLEVDSVQSYFVSKRLKNELTLEYSFTLVRSIELISIDVMSYSLDHDNEIDYCDYLDWTQLEKDIEEYLNFMI